MVRRLDCENEWKDELEVLIFNKEYNETEIIKIPIPNNNAVANSTCFLQNEKNEIYVEIVTKYKIKPSLKEFIKLPVIQLPSIPVENRISLNEFNKIFPNAGIRPLPSSLFAVGLIKQTLYIYNRDYSRYSNIREPIYHIIRVALKYFVNNNFYFVISSTDGYIEGTYYSNNRCNFKEVTNEDLIINDYLYLPKTSQEIPLFHNNKYILAQSFHKDFPYIKGVVDRHYFYHNLYHSFGSFHCGIPFLQKQNKIVFAGQDRDTIFNYETLRHIKIPPRQYFKECIAPKYKKIIVTGGWIEREYMAQNYKYILDIDGRASTYDATYWKMNSGSVIFKPKSIWKQWFYDDYIAGVHFIELKEDFSDIEEKYNWCETHPIECQQMIENCKELLKRVYTFTNVIQYTKSLINELIQGCTNVVFDHSSEFFNE
jgi:hypothetical protein